MKTIILLAAVFVIASAELRSDRVTDVLDEVLKKYDPRVRPNSGVSPTRVALTGYAYQVGPYCGKHDAMNIDMNLRHHWTDPRLVLSLKAEEKGEQIKLGHSFDKSKIWTPDTFFVNSRKAEKMKVMNDNFWMKIKADGRVSFSEHVHVQAKCGDGSKAWTVGETRTCSLKAASYGYNDEEVELKFKDGKDFVVESTLYPYNVTGVSLSYLPSPPHFSHNFTRAVINFEIVKLAEKIATLPADGRD